MVTEIGVARGFRKAFFLSLGMLVVVFAAGCSRTTSPPPAPAGVIYSESALTSLPGWDTDALINVLPALRSSCGVFAKRDDTAWVGSGPAAVSVAQWKAACNDLEHLAQSARGLIDPPTFRQFLERHFAAFSVTTDTGVAEGLFTGYYQPMLPGCRERSATCQTPLYGLPSDLITVDTSTIAKELGGTKLAGRLEGGRLVPYWTRAEIDAGALSSTGTSAAPVVAWVENPVDAHILSIQGSGLIKFADGGVLSLAYAGNNGWPYKSLGKILVEQGIMTLSQVTMPDVRDWLLAHPTQAIPLMRQNARFIFFRPSDRVEAIGSLGTSLVPGRTMAVDPTIMPLGAPVWLDSNDPDGHPLRRLMIAADTGTAIHGPVRGDIFWGNDDMAFTLAGRMKSQGRWFLLAPKS